MDEHELAAKRKIQAAMDANAGEPTIISQRSTRHRGPVKFRTNEQIVAEETAKAAARWGIPVEDVERSHAAVAAEAFGAEAPKPPPTEDEWQRAREHAYSRAGYEPDEALEKAQADADERKEQPVVQEVVSSEPPDVTTEEPSETDDELLGRISKYQVVPTRYRKDLDAALAEAVKRGILR